MVDRQRREVEWTVADADGSITWDRVGTIAVLMDIRRELRRLNSLLMCRNFTGIPTSLRRIALNTDRPKKRKT